MNLPTILILSVSIAIGLVGLVFMLFPDRIATLEKWLNSTWGDREVTALRLGVQAEQTVEQVINRNVLDKTISWDGWTRKHPRAFGAVLCLVAILLGSQV